MKLVGAKSFAKKDGSGFCYLIQYTRELTERELDAGSFGASNGENFVDREVFEHVKALHTLNDMIGKDFVFEYGMSAQGRPYINGIRFEEE